LECADDREKAESMIKVKRVYDPVEASDGARFLVDRLWPRGKKKEGLAIKAWVPEIAPSTALRTWFHHDPGRWPEFKRRYFAELDKQEHELKILSGENNKGTLTLLHASSDRAFNNATALKAYLEMKAGKRNKKRGASEDFMPI